MTKSRKVNDLTQLPELFVEPESEPELGFGLMLEEEQNKPEPVQDIHDAVLGLMYNYRGWTVHDVQLRLPDHPECYLVPTIMAKYAADGRLEAVRGANGILTFTLKKKILDTTITAHRAKRVHREPNVRLAPDPKGVIRPEEGLDIGIWKVMSDYKPRTAYEIRKILAEYKFDSRITDKRLDTLIRTNRWFERRSHKGSGTSYTLRKDFPMPSLLKSTENLVDQTQPTKVEVDAYNQSQGHETKHKAPTNNLDMTLGWKQVVQESISVEGSASTNSQFVDHSASMSKDDPLIVLIWKAMSDRKPYKSADIAALIQAVRPDLKALRIQNTMSTMKAKGWFITEPAAGLTKGAVAGLMWRLKPEIVDPHSYTTTDANYKYKNIDKQELEKQVMQIAPEKLEMPSVNTSQSLQTPASKSLVQVRVHESLVQEVPLLDLTVRIKGLPLSLSECRQLVHELRNLGYGKVVAPAQNSLVNRSITIKDTDFSEPELETLIKGLVAEGLVLANK